MLRWLDDYFGLQWLAGLSIAVLFLAAGILTIGDYGITVDSPENFLWGDIYLRFYQSWNPAYLRYGEGENPLIEYPPAPTHVFDHRVKYRPWMFHPVAKIFTAFTHQTFHERLGWLDDIDAHHLGILVISAAGVFALYAMVYEVFGYAPAVISAASLALYPRFIAHSHNNVKDTPMTCFFIFTMYCFWKAFNTRDLRWSILAGTSLGLSLNVKINAYFMPLIFGVWLFLTYKGGEGTVMMPKFTVERASIKYCLQERRYDSKLNIAVIVILALSVMYLSWPYLWERPLANLFTSMQLFAQGGKDIPVLYNGVIYSSSTDLPFYYAPHYLLIVTPPQVLLLSALGMFEAGRILKSKRKPDSDKREMIILLLLWLLTPLAKYMIPGTVVIDGIRHFLEVVPPLCVFAGLGGGLLYGRARDYLSSRASHPRILAVILVILLYAPTAYANVRLHPYQIAYFNFLVGGVKGAEGRYEIGYWGTALKEAAWWTSQWKTPDVKVMDPMWWHLTAYYLDISRNPGEKNYVILLNDPTMHNISWFSPRTRNIMAYVLENKTPVHTVGVEGVPLAYVYDVAGDEFKNIEGYEVQNYTACGC
ncbi:MAG: phospholipid carrier-dependent glycosyltransferase [Candidatus Altiarchaeales archaeon]|nr:phospholipid carrier-dependent glycosyltransferase [Candidatus Altiarchaeales archaeon]MBD3415975.1 phospholipid carrier-dependent glycosyltransferase [Candidatus Altiarchaeales archaeon]